MSGILKSITNASFFCISQRFGEAVLGFVITDVRNASNVNIGGAIQFAVVGFFLSILPYLIVLPLMKV
ncbi:MAG: hypothetical protein CMO01_15220 [Thalassobius sp.]|nr:hypothetical protein [Thalassovita sp.]